MGPWSNRDDALTAECVADEPDAPLSCPLVVGTVEITLPEADWGVIPSELEDHHDETKYGFYDLTLVNATEPCRWSGAFSAAGVFDPFPDTAYYQGVRVRSLLVLLVTDISAIDPSLPAVAGWV